jgi:hypothetical protein
MANSTKPWMVPTGHAMCLRIQPDRGCDAGTDLGEAQLQAAKLLGSIELD